MAVAPLFIESRDALKRALRLTGAREDSEYLIDEAIRTVRAGFYRHLGTTLPTTIAAYEHTDTPTTDPQIRRSIARTAEIKWVRMELLRTMPTLFADKANVGNAAWNDEGLWQGTTTDLRSQEIGMLWGEITNSLDILLQDEELGNETKVRSMTVGPTTVRRSGGSAGVRF